MTFEERIKNVKAHLPYRYGTILRHKHPEFKLTHIYNVVHSGTKNLKILKALEKEFLKKDAKV